jgi:hypothetical protein
MAGFFRSLFWWNNMKQIETSVPPDEHERPDKSVPSDEFE